MLNWSVVTWEPSWMALNLKGFELLEVGLIPETSLELTLRARVLVNFVAVGDILLDPEVLIFCFWSLEAVFSMLLAEKESSSSLLNSVTRMSLCFSLLPFR